MEAVSGKSVMDHPEANRMLEDVRKGRITGLIFSKLARLARDTMELLEFSKIFRAHDADPISLQESIDTSTPMGRVFYTLIAAFARREREEIAERVEKFGVRHAKLRRFASRKPDTDLFGVARSFEQRLGWGILRITDGDAKVSRQGIQIGVAADKGQITQVKIECANDDESVIGSWTLLDRG